MPAAIIIGAGPGIGLAVAIVLTGGPVAPGGPFDPDQIAEEYWALHAGSE